MPVHDAPEEASRSGVAIAQPIAGEAVDEDGGSAVELDDRRLERVSVQGHGSDGVCGLPAGDPRDQLVEPERCGAQARRINAIVA